MLLMIVFAVDSQEESQLIRDRRVMFQLGILELLEVNADILLLGRLR